MGKWERYIKELFNNDREPLPNLKANIAPPILRAETTKPVDPDEIFSE